MSDYIDREAAIDALNKLADIKYTHMPYYGYYLGALHDAADDIKALPSVQPEEVARDIATIIENEKDMRVILANGQTGWIPVTEELPEEDVEVLISYRYKEGEGDTSHTDIDITSYGQMYFGGNKVGNHKHWRAPFEYFESNYEVVAWMPLPEPWKGEKHEL